jgi:hypothetical protein
LNETRFKPGGVGTADGAAVEGFAVGALLGCGVGPAKVGATLGCTVGAWLGCTVGALLGCAVGASLGCAVGAADGSAVGSAVMSNASQVSNILSSFKSESKSMARAVTTRSNKQRRKACIFVERPTYSALYEPFVSRVQLTGLMASERVGENFPSAVSSVFRSTPVRIIQFGSTARTFTTTKHARTRTETKDGSINIAHLQTPSTPRFKVDSF